MEEPQTESESSESEYDGYAQSESDEEVYDFDLQSNDESGDELDFNSDDEEREEVFIIADDSDDFVDMNDALELAAIDSMEAEGKVRDVNDDLIRFYDSDSESESSSDSDLDIVAADSDCDSECDSDCECENVCESDCNCESSDSESDSESDSDIESDSASEMDTDEEIILLLDSDLENDSSLDSDSESVTDLDVEDEEERQLEHIRRSFAEELQPSEDEVSDISTEAESDDEVFFEVNSEYDSFSDDDEDVEVDAGDPVHYDYYMSDSSDSDSSDGEGVTIYKHRFDLPDRYDSDNDSTDDELDYSEDEEMLRANDSEDEFEIVDLSRELKDSKDCEMIELDDHTYKLNLRLPAMIKEDLKVNFLKNENELVISGKFDFTAEDSDVELAESDDEQDDEVYQSAEETKEDQSESSESSSSESESDSDSESSSSSSSSESEGEEESETETAKADSDAELDAKSGEVSEESEESDSESDEEEIVEDAQQLIKDFQKQEIQFEKHFQFEKMIKFDEIKATFLANGELELIIPNEGVELQKDDNTVAIAIEDAAEGSVPPVLGDDEDFSPVVEFVREDEEMES